MVFDFDCTLSSKHVYHFINAHSHYLSRYHFPYIEAMGLPPSTPQRLEELKCISTALRRLRPLVKESDRTLFVDECFHGWARLRGLKDFLLTLQNKYHADLFIASRGDKDQIVNCLKELDPSHVGASTTTISSQKMSSLFPTERVFGQDVNKADLIKYLLGNPHVGTPSEPVSRDYQIVLYVDDCKDEHHEMLNTMWMQRLPHRKKDSPLTKQFEVYQTRQGKLYIYCKSLEYNGTGITTEIMRDCLLILNDHL